MMENFRVRAKIIFPLTSSILVIFFGINDDLCGLSAVSTVPSHNPRTIILDASKYVPFGADRPRYPF